MWIPYGTSQCAASVGGKEALLVFESIEATVVELVVSVVEPEARALRFWLPGPVAWYHSFSTIFNICCKETDPGNMLDRFGLKNDA